VTERLTPIADQNLEIAARLVEIEAESRPEIPLLAFDSDGDAGRFAWDVMQSGQLLHMAVLKDHEITPHDLYTKDRIRAYLRWLGDNSLNEIKEIAGQTLSHTVENDRSTGILNAKILYCRMRLLKLL
jgi:hypothetical protein